MISCGRWMMQIHALTNSLVTCCLSTKHTGRENYLKNMAMRFASSTPTKPPDMHFLSSFCVSKPMSITVLLVHLLSSQRPAGNCWSTPGVTWVEPTMVAKIFHDWLQWSWHKSNWRSFWAWVFKSDTKILVRTKINLTTYSERVELLRKKTSPW